MRHYDKKKFVFEDQLTISIFQLANATLKANTESEVSAHMQRWCLDLPLQSLFLDHPSFVSGLLVISLKSLLNEPISNGLTVGQTWATASIRSQAHSSKLRSTSQCLPLRLSSQRLLRVLGNTHALHISKPS